MLYQSKKTSFNSSFYFGYSLQASLNRKGSWSGERKRELAHVPFGAEERSDNPVGIPAIMNV